MSAAQQGAEIPVVGFAGQSEGLPGSLTVDLEKLLATRVLIQANSGGGKSYLLRYILENTYNRIQHVLFDLEGEFGSLRERYAYVFVSATEGEGDLPAEPESAALLCRRLVDLGASAILDLYDLSLPEQRRFVRLFLEELMALPRERWKPLLVAIDEAHRVAPEKGSGTAESTEAVASLTSRSRKRGYLPVLATQRLSKLSKDCAAELLNSFIGRTSLDNDVKRAGDDLGFDKAGRASLKSLEPGQFYAYGPAIPAEGVTLVRSGEVLTSHGSSSVAGLDGHAAPAPPTPPESLKEILRQLAGVPREAREEARTLEELREENRDLRERLEQGSPSRATDPEVVHLVEKQVQERLDAELSAREAPLKKRIAGLESRIERAGDLAAKTADALAPGTPDSSFGAGRPGAGEPRREAPDEAREGAAANGSATEFGEEPPATPEVSQRHGRPRPDPRTRMLSELGFLHSMGVRSVPRANLAVLSGQSPKSSAYGDHVAALKAGGLLEYPSGGRVALTNEGRAAAEKLRPQVTRKPRGTDELQEAWCSYLPSPQARVLRVLAERHPDSLSRADLAALTQQSPRSSAFGDHVAALKSLGLAEYPAPGRVRATMLLFPEGLATRT